MSRQGTVNEEQAALIHDHLVRALNLDPSQVRAGAFSVTWASDSSQVTVTWDGMAQIPAEVWDGIVQDVKLTPDEA